MVDFVCKPGMSEMVHNKSRGHVYASQPVLVIRPIRKGAKLRLKFLETLGVKESSHHAVLL